MKKRPLPPGPFSLAKKRRFSESHEKSRLIEWLLDNYMVREGVAVTMKNVMESYRGAICEKENFCLQNFELGWVMKEVFGPSLKRYQRRSANGKPAWFYNLAKIDAGGASDTKSDTSAKAEEMAWEDLPKICKERSWHLTREESFYEWITVDGGEVCNGSRTLREIKIFKDWNFAVRVNNRPVDPHRLGIPRRLKPSRQAVRFLFDVVADSNLCRGFEVSSLRHESTAGKTDVWSSDENPAIKYYQRSLDCRVLLPHDFKQSTRRCCDSCAKLKKSCVVSGKNVGKPCAAQKRDDYMSEQELKDKLQEERRRRKNAERRERSRIEKINREMKSFTIHDHEDFLHIFREVNKESLDDDMKVFWEEQEKALHAKCPKSYRWHPKVVRMCLSIWNRSPMAYKELRECGMLVLPSGRLLQLYKNSCSQQSGFNKSVGKWMQQEAATRKIGPEGREGGIILDEMAIQEDLQLKAVDGKWRLVGLVSLGDEHSCMQKVLKGGDTIEVATHVLQFVFLGNNGFRFPFAHFPTAEADPSSIYVNFWRAVGWLRTLGFQTNYCCCDGGQANRSFIKLHFKNRDPILERFTTTNPFTRKPMVFLLDPSHNFKKIRNNVEKSRPGGVRLLKFGENSIQWSHLYQAYRWDQTNSSLKIHERLTEEHFTLGYASRMRNHLAEEVLSKKMLYLLQAYKTNVSQRQGREAVYLNKTIELIKVTSSLIENFSDTRPISSLGDHRLAVNQEALQWLSSWKEDIQGRKDLTKSEKARCLLSEKLQFDLSSMIIGFHEVCRIAFHRFPGSSISPFRTNSDLVENIFCQERGHNGQNTNPTYAQYGPTMNSIILGQTTSTTTCNTGSVEKLCFFKNGPLWKT